MSIANNAGVTSSSRTARLSAHPVVRIVLGIIVVAVPVMLTLALARMLPDKSMRVMWPQLLAAALCLICYRYYVRRVEKRPVAELARTGAWREVGTGALGIAVVLATVMGLLFATGHYQVTGFNRWTIVVVPVAEMILVAFVEEIIFRGIIFRVVEGSLGSSIALLLSAALFALSHLPNEGVTFLAIAVTAMAGVMLGAAYMATGRLWLAIGIHFGWNFMLGSVFSVAVSGQQGKGLLEGALVGPDWLTGGAYGLEASIATLAIVTLISALLLWRARRLGGVVLPYWKRRGPTDAGISTH